MRERLKTFLCLLLSLTAAVGLMMVRDSAAWLNTHSGEPLPQNLTNKKYAFTFNGTIHSALEYTDANHTPFVITDRNLVRGSAGAENGTKSVSLQLVNSSEIDTAVRFKIFYSSPINGQLTEYNGVTTGSSASLLKVDYPSSAWTFDSTDHYFTRTFTAVNLSQNSGGVAYDLLYGIEFDDAKVEAAMTAANVSSITALNNGRILVAIQARQADYMLWSDIGTISTSSAFVSEAMTATTTP